MSKKLDEIHNDYMVVLFVLAVLLGVILWAISGEIWPEMTP